VDVAVVRSFAVATLLTGRKFCLKIRAFDGTSTLGFVCVREIAFAVAREGLTLRPLAFSFLTAEDAEKHGDKYPSDLGGF
jgi:hypothetical protein